MVYTIAGPDEYLAITGGGINTVKIIKKQWVWPWQKVSRSLLVPHISTDILTNVSANASASSRTTIQ
jgi:hypothetical protein